MIYNFSKTEKDLKTIFKQKVGLEKENKILLDENNGFNYRKKFILRQYY